MAQIGFAYLLPANIHDNGNHKKAKIMWLYVFLSVLIFFFIIMPLKPMVCIFLTNFLQSAALNITSNMCGKRTNHPFLRPLVFKSGYGTVYNCFTNIL